KSLPADPPLSRASSLPQCSVLTHDLVVPQKTLWERACPRRRRYIQNLCRLIHRFREQARSHNVSVLTNDLVVPQKTCGSGLARECGGTFNIMFA
ncbi:hypothetical protein, partial [Pseudomonas atacamensis]|uniref:hypothetical protein n=1 Tax=Pseudomonas atacamensis TaxID=2565368 RepID=UPI003CF04C71